MTVGKPQRFSEGVHVIPPANSSILDSLVTLYNWAMNEKSDLRTSSWLLMSSPWPSLLIVAAYFVVVYGGQKVMAKRQAFDLKTLIMVYNVCLVLLSAYMCWEFFASSFLQPRDKFNLLCEKVDYSTNPAALRLADVCWWYFFSKIIELADTIFFVLRKKNNQISFLHVYHHSTMVMLWWVGVRFVAGGVAYFSPMINCLIHVLMYSYYLLAAAGPRFQKFLWWKKYMTSLQLIQFVIVLFHTLGAMYLNCGYPRPYGLVLILYMISHILLFSNFYCKTYHGAKPRSSSKVKISGMKNGVSCGVVDSVSSSKDD